MKHREYVGPENKYDLVQANQFCNLISIGLREHHKLLDIGCGSLRGGRLFIMYLGKGNYYGIEPNNWLIEDGIKLEIGQELINMREPSFNHNADFDLSVFNTKFDYLVAQSIFSHASQRQIIECCKKAYEVMHENSVFIATFINSLVPFLPSNISDPKTLQGGKKNYDGEEWVYSGCVFYTPGFIISLIESTGLKCEIVPQWHHPNGQTWLKITK